MKVSKITQILTSLWGGTSHLYACRYFMQTPVFKVLEKHNSAKTFKNPKNEIKIQKFPEETKER